MCQGCFATTSERFVQGDDDNHGDYYDDDDDSDDSKLFVPRMFRNDVWKIDMIVKWRFVRGDDDDNDDNDDKYVNYDNDDNDNHGDDNDDNVDLCKQSGWVMTILNIGHADCCIWHPG